MSVRITPKESKRSDLKRFSLETKMGSDDKQEHELVVRRDGATVIALSAPEEGPEAA
jgi:hypothetical protein